LAQIDLTDTISKLRSYQASRKFKGAARALMAINRLTAFTKKPSAVDSEAAATGDESETLVPTEDTVPSEAPAEEEGEMKEASAAPTVPAQDESTPMPASSENATS
jgi:hypothetical protein